MNFDCKKCKMFDVCEMTKELGFMNGGCRAYTEKKPLINYISHAYQDVYNDGYNVGEEETRKPYCPECGSKMDKEDTNVKTTD